MSRDKDKTCEKRFDVYYEVMKQTVINNWIFVSNYYLRIFLRGSPKKIKSCRDTPVRDISSPITRKILFTLEFNIHI